MKQITLLNSLTSRLIFGEGNSLYRILFNINPKVEKEKIFVNSAFVETGKNILTGFSTANVGYFNCSHKPTIIDVEKALNKIIDKYTEEKITKQFVWNGYNVNLSRENQINYASWYMLSKDNADIFPIVSKFRKGGNTVYYNFSNKEEVKDFYTKIVKYISECVQENRKLKDAIDLNAYAKSLSEL